jgi:hypothetical protein
MTAGGSPFPRARPVHPKHSGACWLLLPAPSVDCFASGAQSFPRSQQCEAGALYSTAKSGEGMSEQAVTSEDNKDPARLAPHRLSAVPGSVCWIFEASLLLGRSFLMNLAQGSICCWKLAGVQHLYARVVVAIERRHCARTPGPDRLCRISEP